MVEALAEAVPPVDGKQKDGYVRILTNSIFFACIWSRALLYNQNSLVIYSPKISYKAPVHIAVGYRKKQIADKR